MQYSDRSILKQERLKKKRVRFSNILDIHTIY